MNYVLIPDKFRLSDICDMTLDRQEEIPKFCYQRRSYSAAKLLCPFCSLLVILYGLHV